MINSKSPEHYICNMEAFKDIFTHMCLAEYRIFDHYIVPEYVHKSLEVPITLFLNLSRLQALEHHNIKIQSILEDVIEHVILHLPYRQDIHLSEWSKMWKEIVIGYLKHKIDFNDYLVYITFQTPDYEDSDYHCHIILFNLEPSEENNILLKAINKSPK